MFFLAFAGSIRIFTLFLNLLNSEIFLIPTIILLASVFAFFQWKNKQQINSPLFKEGGWKPGDFISNYAIITHEN